MKTLKLEVGKTYRSREGEEVKIVGMGNKGWDYWEGSNGEWYYEGGKWSYVTKEHPEDLIEEVTATRHTFDIPDGVKKVYVVYQENGFGGSEVAEIFSSRNIAREYVIDEIFGKNQAYKNKTENVLNNCADQFIHEHDVLFNWR